MKKKTDTVYLFVDGTNLYAGQYELFGPEKYLDFGKFIVIVEKHLSIRFKKIYFYASYSPRPKVPTRKQIAYLRNEALFYRSVRKTKHVIFITGHRSPTSGKEKGIDMHLGIDMVKYGFLRQYSVAYLITGDADLIYAVETVKELSIPVHAIFLPNRFSIILSYNVQSSIVMNYKKKFPEIPMRLPKTLRVINVTR